MLGFCNTDEINEYLFRDTDPLSYCKSLIADASAEIRAYLDGKGREKHFCADEFFARRQCTIFMKNHTAIHWHIEMTLEEVILPDLDQIDYVIFHYSIPVRMTAEEADKLGIPEEDRAPLPKNPILDLGDNECSFYLDSIQGAFSTDEPYGKQVFHNPYHRGDYRHLDRHWTEWSVQLGITKRGYGGTYFADVQDGIIGAYVAEQLLMSNRPENRSLEYGTEDYQALAPFAPYPPEIPSAIYRKHFIREMLSYANRLQHIFEFPWKNGVCCSTDAAYTAELAAFVCLYAHSLLRCAHASNFSIIGHIYRKYLRSRKGRTFPDRTEQLMKEIRAVCRADYFTEPKSRKLNTPLQHFQAAVWALCNSENYMDAMKQILSFTDYQHSGRLAVTLTGVFAGIYYQHYGIPKHLLTENRYYDRFSLRILPLDHEVYQYS